MSNPIVNLSSALAQALKDDDPETEQGYKHVLNSLLQDSSSEESYIYGLPERTYVYCISQTLQSLATSDNVPTHLQDFIWNPIVASLVKCISQMAYRQPLSKIKEHESSVPPQSRELKVERPPASLSKYKKSKNHNLPSAQRLKPKRVSKPEQAKGVETPPIKSDRKAAEPTLNDRRAILEILKTASRPVFKCQSKPTLEKGFVQCLIPGCSTCLQHAMSMPLTKCCDISRHPSEKCHVSGWFPHVVPALWGAIKLAHKDENMKVHYNSLPSENRARPLAEKAPIPGALIKRKWTQAHAEVLTSESEDCDSMTSSRKTRRWSAEMDIVSPYSQKLGSHLSHVSEETSE